MVREALERVVETGTHEALLARGGLYASWWLDSSRRGRWRRDRAAREGRRRRRSADQDELYRRLGHQLAVLSDFSLRDAQPLSLTQHCALPHELSEPRP